MHGEVIGVETNTSIQDAIEIMRCHGFSQLPVMREGHPVGSISEKTLLDYILEAKDNNISKETVGQIMEDLFPLVGEETPISILTSLLKVYPAILVQSHGEIKGIITKADLLGAIA
jgi:predicted transcriptional regulator